MFHLAHHTAKDVAGVLVNEFFTHCGCVTGSSWLRVGVWLSTAEVGMPPVEGGLNTNLSICPTEQWNGWYETALCKNGPQQHPEQYQHGTTVFIPFNLFASRCEDPCLPCDHYGKPWLDVPSCGLEYIHTQWLTAQEISEWAHQHTIWAAVSQCADKDCGVFKICPIWGNLSQEKQPSHNTFCK